MKRIYYIGIILILFALQACETDNKKYYAGDYISPEIDLPVAGSRITLTEATANDSVQFKWEAAAFGFPAAITYTVQIAIPDTYFESAVKIAESKSTSAAVTQATLNNSVLIAGLVPETPTEVEVRVNASINNNIRTLYSEPIRLMITAYNVEVVYPILFVPGSYQGWNPADSSTVVTSPKADGTYEGYFYFPANTEFKFTGQPDWNPLNWGEGGGGKLQAGAGNIKVTTAGFYKVIANINNLTYSLTPVSWSITGSATSNTPIALIYNESKHDLEITTHLNSGEFVFKETGAGNRVLGLYFGNQLTDNGSQIIVEEGGNYTISLNLQKYPYTFSIK